MKAYYSGDLLRIFFCFSKGSGPTTNKHGFIRALCSFVYIKVYIYKCLIWSPNLKFEKFCLNFVLFCFRFLLQQLNLLQSIDNNFKSELNVITWLQYFSSLQCDHLPLMLSNFLDILQRDHFRNFFKYKSNTAQIFLSLLITKEQLGIAALVNLNWSKCFPLGIFLVKRTAAE